MGPDPAVAQIRLHVRRSLAALAPGDLVLAACSGGADSLALAAALAFEAPRRGLRAGGVTVDHGLQAGSAEQAGLVCRILQDMGLDPVQSVRAAVAAPPAAGAGPSAVAGPGRSRYQGPEGAARAARYAALDEVAASTGAAAILLGHTADDQAETVLLGLARGSGARSLAGMAPRTGRYLRPLLHLRRAQTRAACAAAGLQPWQDPHNSDPAYARARVRHQVLPVLEELLGPGVAEALARTADQLRADADALDCLAAGQAGRLAAADGALPAGQLAELPGAVRTRLLRSAAIAAGCPAGALGARHIGAMDALVTRWRGQQWIDLPGDVRCQRQCGRLIFTAGARSEGAGGRQ
ncbi:MAG TPA: tRNA lysidine(34) synthetase TilS [Streptosporangiaceae bacterium]|jgi:tRNA(Ile)-lysidine synthase|nr:tRNA lysidine(34) synthetase TilS [Streptosporangiaceae bacterium]